jgi:hypothetical protein
MCMFLAIARSSHWGVAVGLRGHVPGSRPHEAMMLKYSDGTVVSVGDRICLGAGDSGRIFAVIDDGAFAASYPAQE